MESLKAWMAGVCQKHRQERELQAAAAAAAEPAEGGWAQAPDNSGSGLQAGSGSGWSDTGAEGSADAAAVLQEHFAAARQALPTRHGVPAAPGRRQLQLEPAWHYSGAKGQLAAAAAHKERAPDLGSGPDLSLSVTGKPAVTPGCTDSARTSGAGGAPVAEGAGGSRRRPGAAPPAARPWSAGPLASRRAASLTVEEVTQQRQAAGMAGDLASPADKRPGGLPVVRPGSAALAAWQAANLQRFGAAPPPPAAQPWQQQAWDAFGRPPGARRPSASSAFLDRVATFTMRQQAALEEAV